MTSYAHCKGTVRAAAECARDAGSVIRMLDVEAEQEDVSILHDVLLSFLPHHALFLHALPAGVRYEVRIARRLRLDEATFEVGVDHAGRLRGGVAAMDRPRANLLL